MISPNVVIMTQAELKERDNNVFQKGVERGRFEESMDRQTKKDETAKQAEALSSQLVCIGMMTDDELRECVEKVLAFLDGLAGINRVQS